MEQREEIINAVSKMQHFIEQNLQNEICANDLAKCCNYSVYYSAKIFKDNIGITTFEYIRKRRLTKASHLLINENLKVIDVALSFTFNSHEGFTRAFSKMFNTSPKKYSQNPEPIRLFMPYNIKSYYAHLKNKESDIMSTKAIFTQVIEKPERKLILKRGIKSTNYFEYCEEVGCDVWGILASIKEALYEPISMWLPENMIKENTSTYAMGVEVPSNYSGKIPEGFEIINLNPCMIMIFQGEPYDDENFENSIKEMWEHIKNFNPKIYGYEYDEQIAPIFQLEPKGYRGYIEGRPVKKLN